MPQPVTRPARGAAPGWVAGNTMTTRPQHWLDADEQTTLPALFQQRVARTPDAVAYHFFAPRRKRWITLTWRQAADRVVAWGALLLDADVKRGDRVAIMLRNSPEWLCLDQAILSLGAVTVGLYCTDTPGNNAAIIDDSGARLLVAVKQHWIRDILGQSECAGLDRILAFSGTADRNDARVRDAEAEIGRAADAAARQPDAVVEPAELASLVYASGTSARPRGTRMSHRNLAWCAQAVADALPVIDDEHCVSYVPLPNSYGRVTDAYRAMITGAAITFCRHPRFLNITLARSAATTLVAVPRVYERLYSELHRQLAKRPRTARRLVAFTIGLGYSVFEHQQGRAGRRLRHVLWPLLRATVARRCLRPLGGRMVYGVCAGAALPKPVARTVIGLGLPVLQGYGLTEAGPIVSVNRLNDNDPNSVGLVLDGVEIRLEADGELLVRSPGVMTGYWNDDEATERAIDAAGWLHTGDKVSRLDKSHLFLTGRIKEVIALATGDKALPEPLEAALRRDGLVEHAIVVGEARPSLAAVVNCRPDKLVPIMHELGLHPENAEDLASVRLEHYFLRRFDALLTQFPIHAQIRHVAITTDLWTQDNGLLDKSGHPRRRAVARHYDREITRLFGRRADSEKTDASQNTNLG